MPLLLRKSKLEFLGTTRSRAAAHAAIAAAIANHDGSAGGAARCIAHLVHVAHCLGRVEQSRDPAS